MSSKEQTLVLARARMRAQTPETTAPEPKDGVAETAADTAVGAGTGASLGFDDEIAGGLNAIKNGLTGKGLQGYTAGRDEYRDRKALAEKRSPIANRVGQFAGGAAGALATGGTGTAARLAAEGALAGVGNADEGRGDIASAGDVASAAGRGAVAGVVGGKIVGAAMKGAGKLFQGAGAPAAREAADESLVAVSGQNPARVAESAGGVPRAARAMREYGVGSKGLPGARDVARQASAGLDQAEARRGLIANMIDAKGVQVSGANIARKIRAAAKNLPPENEALSAHANSLEREAQAYEGPTRNRVMPFREANTKRAEMAKPRVFEGDGGQAERAKIVHSAIAESMQEAADQHPGMPGALGSQWRKHGQDMAALIDAKDAAINRAGGQMAAGPGVGLSPNPASIEQRFAAKHVMSRYSAAAAHVHEANAQFQGQLAKKTAPLGRMLARRAGTAAGTAGRVSGAAAGDSGADAGAARVQAAAVDPDAAARAHYLESRTNPDYARASIDPEE